MLTLNRISSTHHSLGMAWVALLLFSLLGATAFAQPMVSQVVRSSGPIYNQDGKILYGNEPARMQMGLPYVRGCRVEILIAVDGVIYPPQPDGSPHPSNKIVQVTGIGRGIDPDQQTSGEFSIAVTPRPAGNTWIFVRVFNRPSLELATHYSDSVLFQVSSWENIPFVADLPNTSNPIDKRDDDEDGLINSLEHLRGSDPYVKDTDGDGFTDLQEYLAGTDPDNEESLFEITDIRLENGHIVIRHSADPAKISLIADSSCGYAYSDCSSEASMSSTGSEIGGVVEMPGVPGEPFKLFRLGAPSP